MKTGRAGRTGSRNKSQPKPLGAALQDLVNQLGLGKTLGEYEVVTSWEAIVGEQIAKVTRVQRVENGVVFVSVTTAPWRAELSMKRMDIMQKINAALGRDIIKEIRFR